MSGPNGDRGQQWIHPILGDLTVWYSTFEKYAAAAAVNGADFHGAHVEAPATLDRVWQILQDHAAEIEAQPPHTVEQLQSILEGKVPVGPYHEGSICHMIWHWIHGDHD
ncbi:MAG TPA: hypothetical protein VGX25_30115 [Actinophytocola sp.]|uniref:hypothetical protein n=1 Tax=Actinophytocola sp. TaxID=1872138 RepID=UPI002DDCDE22|nr:hypothetical protein [Actinophytocola sp.]HEV2783663.1 hypothetical protein [Actinophytocola sp.]